MTTGVAAQPQAASPPTPASTDAIGAWLDRLLRLTRLPAPEAAELRDELDAHLRERVRDLMLAGNDEPDAIHKSISELGDLALLAQRYREASRTPRRRLTMNIALIAAAGAALGLSTAALRQAQPDRQPEPAADTRPEDLPGGTSGLFQLGLIPEDVGPDGQGTYRLGAVPDRALLRALALRGFTSVSVDDLADGSYQLRLGPAVVADPDDGVPALGGIPLLRYYSSQGVAPSRAIPEDIDGAPLAEVLAMLAESQDLRPYIHWRDLQGLPEDELTALPLAGQQLDRAFEMINDALELDAQVAIEYRADDGLLEVASREYFDRRERELVTYSVSDLVYADAPLQTTEESEVLVQLITEIVETDVWAQNGGEIGSIYCVGGKLFVNAPPRVHAQVAWLLTELLDTAERSSLSPAPDATEPGATTGQIRGLHSTLRADAGAAPTPPVADSAVAPER